MSPWRVVGLLWVAYLINYLDRQVVFSIFPALRAELGFSDAALGLIGTVFIWVYSLSMPVTGRLADMFRRDRIIALSLALWSLATLGTGLAGSVAWMLVWRAVMGVTEALYVPAALALIADLHPGATRSRALAVHSSAQFAGIVAGGWSGGWMADHIGWRPGFFGLAVLGMVYAAVLFRALRGVARPRPAGARGDARPLDVFRSSCYVALAAAFFAFCIVLWILYAWLPSFIFERFGLSMTASGLAATLFLQTGSATGVLAGGVLGDWTAKRVPGGRFYIAGFGIIACAPFAYLALAAGSIGGLKLAAAAFGFFSGLFVANLFASAYDVIAPSNYGFGTGALNMLGGVAGGAGMLAVGLFRGSVGMAALVLWGAAAAAALALVMIGVTARAYRGVPAHAEQ